MKTDVVVIGAGMGGLVNARWLRAAGFEVVVLEAHDGPGGQWDRTNERSGVWPQMRTNTVRCLTRFSEVDYPEEVPVFPRNGEVLELLERYVEQHGLGECLRLGAQVSDLCRDGAGYVVTWTDGEGEHRLHAERVVVASGRFNRPEIPPIAGLETFAGDGGVVHAFRYKEPERYRDQTVVVCGGSISALEIVSDLAMLGATRVHLAQRRQRYVMPKMIAGTPIESYVFTRADGVLMQSRTTPEVERVFAERVLALAGDPARYGAPATHPDPRLAGVAGNQHYLHLVSEDRVEVHPWIREVDGRTVTFDDGTRVEADAVVVATGFDLHLPFLAEDLRDTLGLTAKSMELAEFTFHPDLPGLAFVGMWAQLGAYAVPLEQQARWIAYTWSGRHPAPTDAELRSWVAACVADGQFTGYREQHEMAVRFARLAGVDPDPARHPEIDPVLAAVLPRFMCTADTFRLVGPDSLVGARERVLRDFRRFAQPVHVDAVSRLCAEIDAEIDAAPDAAAQPGPQGSTAGP